MIIHHIRRGGSGSVDHLHAAAQFRPDDRILSVQEHGSGNVNDTYLVTLDSGRQGHFILQRINQHVFPRPDLIILNIRTFSEHVRRHLLDEPAGSRRQWEVPRILPTPDGKDYWTDPSGECWRAMSFVARSTGHTTIQSIDHAREAGYALGRFHSLICDLPVDRLHDTLVGFHITPRYLRHYDRVLENGVGTSSPEVQHCLRFVGERRSWVSVLEDARAGGDLLLRPIHGDPKVDNIMIDDMTGQAVSLVDLDTVKPGLIHYDIGDCLRSCCNPLGEETDRIEEVHFETDLCRAILQGYLSVANCFLSEHDYAYLYDAIRLISFELGLRFFTDYLEGNVYFKARYRDHNLWRALIQFKLTESIESQEGAIRAIIAELRDEPGL
ncbi:MAG: aminoglycoside phosphotransferase family protein [Anaerolineae bacterium]|nr:aminoglycoside phosphotransferase family protein [Anaerolineae bacterium]